MPDPLWINAEQDTSVGTATIDAGTDEFTVTTHGLVDGDRVTTTNLTGGADGPLCEGSVYYVVNAAADTFQVSEFLHGCAVEFTSNGGADIDYWRPAYTARELRRAMAMWMYPHETDRFGAREGVRPGNGAKVSVSGTTWTVHDLMAEVYPGLTSVSGPYTVQFPEQSGELDPADGTNDRIDSLDLQIQDDDEDSSTQRRAHVVYVPGTPAGAPVPPALTANSLWLATLLVPSGGSPSPSINTLGQPTVALGGILPVASSSELPSTGRYAGQAAYQQDTGELKVFDGSNWISVGDDPPPTVQGLGDPTSFTFTNTSYSTTGQPANCAAVFTAPRSGRVMLHWGGGIDIAQDTGAAAHLSAVVRTGGIIGAGTTVLAADDDRSVRTSRSQVGTNQGGARIQANWSHLVSGLTPGDTYNVRLEHRVTSQTGLLFRRHVEVVPTS